MDKKEMVKLVEQFDKQIEEQKKDVEKIKHDLEQKQASLNDVIDARNSMAKLAGLEAKPEKISKVKLNETAMVDGVVADRDELVERYKNNPMYLRIIDYLAEHGEVPRKELKTNIDPNMDFFLERLVNDNVIKRVGRGVYALV